MIARNVNTELFLALKSMLPGLPEHCRKLTLKLESDAQPMVEVEYMATTNSEIKEVELRSETFALHPVDEDGFLHGEIGELEPDPRLDEVISLLKKIHYHQCLSAAPV